MTPERIAELEAIDFCWEIRPETKAAASSSSLKKGDGKGSVRKSRKAKRNNSLDLLGHAAAML